MFYGIGASKTVTLHHGRPEIVNTESMHGFTAFLTRYPPGLFVYMDVILDDGLNRLGFAALLVIMPTVFEKIPDERFA